MSVVELPSFNSGATPLAGLEKLLGYRVCDIERHFTDVECFFEL